MTDALTEDGILSDDALVTLHDYISHHGEPVYVGPDRVIFRDDHSTELTDWADALGVSRGELSEQMHGLAREVYRPGEPGDPWSVADPVVFDAETFRRDDFEAIALLLRRGCSPAEALDWFATKERHWTQTDWSTWRAVTQQNVSANVSRADEELERIDHAASCANAER